MSQAQPQQEYTFFYNGPLSQWSASPFEIEGILYPTAEHYMMWYKDQVFGGGFLSERILAAKHPKEAKALGRIVPNFDIHVWNAVAKPGVFRGNMAKFTQNKSHLKALMQSEGLLVEASPIDVVWGVGLAEGDPLILDPKNWRGTNWLGEVLTDVREALRLAVV